MAMRERMGLSYNPLDEVVAKVLVSQMVPVFWFSEWNHRPPNPNTCSNTSSKSSLLNSALWMDKK